MSAAAWPFDLDACLNSGQVFHWEQKGGNWIGAIGDAPVVLTRNRAADSGDIRRYLAADHDLPAIAATFPADDIPLQQAIAYCPGLRILRQPKWECLATFITSSLKQVPHIRQISLTLRKRFGAAVQCNGHAMNAYPAPEALAAAGEPALRACGLGYRAAFLHRAACDVASGRIDLDAIAALPDDEARSALMQFHGVGEKIAHCVLLFAYERLGAFPIDVWVERVLRELYFKGKRRVTAKRIRDFAEKHFGPNRGYAQQFLFHHARMTRMKPNPKNPMPHFHERP